MKEEDNAYLSIKDFAKRLRVHPNTIRKAIKTGYINAFRVGNSIKSSWRIPTSEIHKLAMIEWESVVTKIAKEQSINVINI